jgi:hypothetical protein
MTFRATIERPSKELIVGGIGDCKYWSSVTKKREGKRINISLQSLNLESICPFPEHFRK